VTLKFYKIKIISSPLNLLSTPSISISFSPSLSLLLPLSLLHSLCEAEAEEVVTATLALVEVELIKGKPTVVAIGSRDALNDTYQRLKLMAKLERELGGTMRCRTLEMTNGREGRRLMPLYW
jgi:hypothetical protein